MKKTPEGHNICDHCFEVMYEPKKYGPPPGMESLEERRARALREAEERERKLREIEAKRGRKVGEKKTLTMILIFNNLLQDSFGNTPSIYCMKIAETCEIAPDQIYSL